MFGHIPRTETCATCKKVKVVGIPCLSCGTMGKVKAEARDDSATELARQTERAEAAERQRDELVARLEWMATALHEGTTSLSDFALSFAEVRAAWDCRQERQRLRALVEKQTGQLKRLRRAAGKAGKR